MLLAAAEGFRCPFVSADLGNRGSSRRFGGFLRGAKFDLTLLQIGDVGLQPDLTAFGNR